VYCGIGLFKRDETTNPGYKYFNPRHTNWDKDSTQSIQRLADEDKDLLAFTVCFTTKQLTNEAAKYTKLANLIFVNEGILKEMEDKKWPGIDDERIKEAMDPETHKKLEEYNEDRADNELKLGAIDILGNLLESKMLHEVSIERMPHKAIAVRLCADCHFSFPIQMTAVDALTYHRASHTDGLTWSRINIMITQVRNPEGSRWILLLNQR
jgi:hypothetical protein